jgi:hypothetical protein
MMIKPAVSRLPTRRQLMAFLLHTIPAMSPPSVEPSA